MATTETGDVTGGWDGDVPETGVTNEMASEPGFPARKEDGTLVNIVKQYPEGTRKVLEDAEGNKYLDDSVTGRLVKYESDLASDVEPETATDVQTASVEAQTDENQAAISGEIEPQEEAEAPEAPEAA